MGTLIIGGGKVGLYLTQRFLEHDYDATLIENRRERYEKLCGEVDASHLIYGDAAEPSVLERAGIRSADAVVCVTGADETNLIVSTLAKMEYGVRRVLARVNNPKNAWVFTPVMGVDSAVNVADITARMLAEHMESKLDDKIFEENPAVDRPV
ncbi:MAG: NAD-binding protein [Coriobacteriia bacterium]|nr:NAD-binding protein [Coriobacteriia bacterium]